MQDFAGIFVWPKGSLVVLIYGLPGGACFGWKVSYHSMHIWLEMAHVEGFTIYC